MSEWIRHAIHWCRHRLGWTLGYVDHYVDADGHLFIAHHCGTCREPNRLTAVHSFACRCFQEKGGKRTPPPAEPCTWCGRPMDQHPMTSCIGEKP
jgi:hypothetical protein